MGRVKAYIRAGNQHRSEAVGGRRRNTRVWADLNTDNAYHRDCCMRTQAYVSDRDRGDYTVFDVDLPGEQAEGWHATIAVPGAKIAPAHRAERLTYQELFEIYKHLGNVYLPGGGTLAHALACVAFCESHGIAHFNRREQEERTPIKRRSLIRE